MPAIKGDMYITHCNYSQPASIKLDNKNIGGHLTPLHFHIKRSHYQASLWRQADKQHPELPPPETMGWTIQSRALVPTLISLPSLPESCIELITCKCTTQCRRGNCNCRRKRLPCTSACICSASRDVCRNDY